MVEVLNSKSKKIGETLVEEGYITESNVSVVLLRQEYGDTRLFGQIATSLNYLSSHELKKVLPLK